jgi:magnesium-transporting ATPase (P-type)
MYMSILHDGIVLVFWQLTGPMPIMLWMAAIIEAVIGNYGDMGILLGIQFINAGISFYETTKAGNAVKALKASLKPQATVKRDGKWQNLEAGLVVPGDLVKLAAGSAVPADTYVNEGEIEVDQSAMTGESLPVKFRPGDVCKMGSTVTRGETDGTVETTGQNTFFGKTAAMLQSVENVGGSLQTLLLNMMKVLVTLSLTLCIIAFIYLVVHGNQLNATLPTIFQEDGPEIVKVLFSFISLFENCADYVHRCSGSALLRRRCARRVHPACRRDCDDDHARYGLAVAVEARRHRHASRGDRGDGRHGHALLGQDRHPHAQQNGHPGTCGQMY